MSQISPASQPRTTRRARTTIVRPQDATLQDALRLAALFALIKLALHVAANLWQSHIGWGYFRDEFYYIACGRHLAWGYVDHGPIVALQARASEILFGHSLAGLRLLSALAGAARIFLTGLLAWSLGGRRPAQGLAMLGVLAAPQYLGTDSFLSMNSFESLFWMTCLLALILILRGDPQRYWLLFGLSAGLGVLNKPSMAFFLFALLLALLLTPQRRILFTRWAALGTALLLLIALPNLLWQMHHHWPTFEFLHNGRVQNKNLKLAPLPFVLKQIVNLGPLNALIWIPGLVWLLRRGAHRWLGLTFVLFFGVMLVLHAKDYYVSPIYPILFAAGAIAWETRFAARASVAANRAFAFPVFETITILGAIFVLPLAIPFMTPAHWLRYTRATGLSHLNGNSENQVSGPLPQFYADRFGWQEEVDQVSRVFHALSPEDQRRVGILCTNYGEAGAINYLGHGLPVAITGHNTYWFWGPNHYTGEVMISLNGASPEEMRQSYDSVEIVGHMDHPYAMPYEHRTIYLVRGRHKNLTADWLDFKHYD